MVLKAPPDLQSGPTWFYRGTLGVKQTLNRLLESGIIIRTVAQL